MLEDVQATPDLRGIPIDAVGVNGIRIPIIVLDRAFAKQETIATVSMSVALSAETKGAHLSRFIEALSEHDREFSVATIPTLLEDLRKRAGAPSARVRVEFLYFISRAAPVSGKRALLDFQCGFEAESSIGGSDFVLTVAVPVTSVCPCSKAISDYGAHNQRGLITISLRTSTTDEPAFVWIEEVIEFAERSASAPLYPILKREDERHVTMQAYDNPVFVEDMARGTAQALQSDPRVAWFRVHVHNEESIHNHGAFAELEWRRP